MVVRSLVSRSFRTPSRVRRTTSERDDDRPGRPNLDSTSSRRRPRDGCVNASTARRATSRLEREREKSTRRISIARRANARARTRCGGDAGGRAIGDAMTSSGRGGLGEWSVFEVNGGTAARGRVANGRRKERTSIATEVDRDRGRSKSDRTNEGRRVCVRSCVVVTPRRGRLVSERARAEREVLVELVPKEFKRGAIAVA